MGLGIALKEGILAVTELFRKGTESLILEDSPVAGQLEQFLISIRVVQDYKVGIVEN